MNTKVFYYLEDLNFNLLITEIEAGKHLHKDYGTSSAWDRFCNIFICCFPWCRLADNNVGNVFLQLQEDTREYKHIKTREYQDLKEELDKVQAHLEEIERAKIILNLPAEDRKSGQGYDLEKGEISFSVGRRIAIMKPKTAESDEFVKISIVEYFSDHRNLGDWFNYDIISYSASEEILNVVVLPKKRNGAPIKIGIDVSLYNEASKKEFLDHISTKYESKEKMNTALEQMIDSINKKKAVIEEKRSLLNEEYNKIFGGVLKLMNIIISRKEKYPENKDSPEVSKLNSVRSEMRNL